ncbi:Homoserine/homoserine lactone efflux protein [Aquicella siphonis]|uniref:Homoserine/homoserine lactone efflux protein n=1 Tax=Aquicella siphonis TaxID=254247 RepID=A0A5E4PHW4_9COXI|nr:LysE family translocator [Aquicella siphonis]VVC76185.1 Homoserine/homoserine lactone efflux protein [Aquicella siphonis]
MTQNWLIYFIAVLTVALIPGPDMLYIISQSLNHGKRLGLAAALGIGAGCFVHIFAVSIGLSSFLFHSSLAFSLIKYLGACYLLYLGIQALLKKQSALLENAHHTVTGSWRKVFIQGLFTNMFNPKVALFFLAFLPQFVTPASSHSMGLQLLILGLIFNGIGTFSNVLVALFFGTAKQWLTAHPAALKIQQKISGFLFIGLGLKLAAFER